MKHCLCAKAELGAIAQQLRIFFQDTSQNGKCLALTFPLQILHYESNNDRNYLQDKI